MVQIQISFQYLKNITITSGTRRCSPETSFDHNQIALNRHEQPILPACGVGQPTPKTNFVSLLRTLAGYLINNSRSY